MIGKLKGRFEAAGQDGVAIIDVGGVGYCVRLSLSTLTQLQITGVSDISLFIYTRVAEDAIDLYGFITEEELAFFKQLMSVSGIGPKSALSILNVADVSTLKRGIAKGDASALTKVFGIGKKSAERIVVELKDKMVFDSPSTELGATTSDADVVEALMALGYTSAECRKVLREISPDLETTRERIAAALKHLGSRAGAL